MPTEYFIPMDTHCRTTDGCVKTARGKLVKREHLSTGIPQLSELIESVPHPRRVAFEESAMAGWLWRNLRGCADEMIVSEPRRNALISKDGDKDDPIDAEKLNDLHRSGHLKRVYQLDQDQKAAMKQVVGRRWGVLLKRSRLMQSDGREFLKMRLQEAKFPKPIVDLAEDLWRGLERADAVQANWPARTRRWRGWRSCRATVRCGRRR
jgi:hypothetical protein